VISEERLPKHSTSSRHKFLEQMELKIRVPKVLNKCETSIINESCKDGTLNEPKHPIITSKPQFNTINGTKLENKISLKNLKSNLHNKLKKNHIENKTVKMTKEAIIEKMNYSKSQNILGQNFNQNGEDKVDRYLNIFYVII
jgi:hypothetical protein